MAEKKSTHIMHTFVWDHNENGAVSTVQLPVRIDKTVDDDYGISGKLVCNTCKNPLKQFYECPQGHFTGTRKDVLYRYDKENDIVYEDAQKSAFMATKTEPVIRTQKEIPLSEVLLNAEFIREFYEVYSNENQVALSTIAKVHKWLLAKQKALLVTYGYRDKNRAGLIFPSKDKLLLAEIRDYQLIRTPKQTGLASVRSSEVDSLNAVSEDREPEMYAAFVEKIKSGEPMPTNVATKEEPVVVVQGSFLD